jgi:hypothetical protein
MSKRIRIPVRALGSEIEDPRISALASWVSAHRGIEADLITYKLEESLRIQRDVDIPASGGRFYQPRLITSLTGMDEGVLSNEPAADYGYIIDDADRIVSLRKGAWCSIPAPHLWDIQDHFYLDEEAFRESLCECTRQIMRAMRDRGIKGHILLCDRYLEEEIEELAGPKVLFYTENPRPEGLSVLLEHQRSIAVPGDRLEIALGLLDEFDIHRLIVVEPSKEALNRVQSFFDPGSFEAGGYCRRDCAGYWSELIESAFITR